ncbi:hypothetical protein OPV22_022013 [Ensete ventricosum]|uniref:Uncharacterized protein n=1 Tax=Ensete ventricosum TaxID=4639 RepID=A0AAV8QIF2_ENSVE|nr:hypothetical protein OPV22_022013 [Ensete ventricosum]
MAGAAAKKAAAGTRLRQREAGEEEKWPAADEGGEEGSSGKDSTLSRVGRRHMRRWQRLGAAAAEEGAATVDAGVAVAVWQRRGLRRGLRVEGNSSVRRKKGRQRWQRQQAVGRRREMAGLRPRRLRLEGGSGSGKQVRKRGGRRQVREERKAATTRVVRCRGLAGGR